MAKTSMQFQTISINGDAVKQAIAAFTKAHNGEKPKSQEEIALFLKTTMSPASLAHHWHKYGPKPN
ncbi:MAG: hypothetical protein QM790_11350 [Nibricoccus sp.]